MIPSAFIGDGFDFKAYIRPVPLLSPELRFTYRPLTPLELAAFSDETDRMNETDKRRRTAEVMAHHIETWSLQPEKPEPAMLLRLKPYLFRRLLSILFGDEAGDAEDAAKNLPEGSSSSC